MKTIIVTDKAPAPVGPYSQAVVAGGSLFCSGQVSIDPKTNAVFTGAIEVQTKMVLENISAVLEKSGLGFQNVVKTTIFLTSMNDFTKVNEIYGSYFTEQPPARSTIAVAGLPKGVNVEIEVIAKR